VAKIILIHTQGIAFESEKFDEQVTQEYSDYRRVIPETPAAEAGADNGAESGSDSSANTGALSEAVVEEEEEEGEEQQP
jgi:hypothetical protein